jgi:hypothetical protein
MGMEKRAPTEFSCNDDSCFEKAKATGEQHFTLRAQDVSAPRTIAFWIMENVDTAPESKLRHALEDALRARRWPTRKRAD